MATVRQARSSDAEGIAEAHVASWKVAYRGMVPDEYLDSLEANDRVEQWKARIADDAEYILVSENGMAIVGFASYFVHNAGATAEFNTIYLRPDHWRHGIGRQLHDALVEDMRKRGCANAVLWVHPHNTRAREFYESCGWSETGETKVEPSWGELMPAMQYGKAL